MRICVREERQCTTSYIVWGIGRKEGFVGGAKENQKASAVDQKRAQRDQIWHTRKQEPAMFSDGLGLLRFVFRDMQRPSQSRHNLSAESLVLRHFSAGGGGCGLVACPVIRCLILTGIVLMAGQHL